MSFKTTEEKTCFDVMNLNLSEAVSTIRKRDLVDRIVWRDGKSLELKDPCYISSRINLKVKRGKVVSAQIG